MLCISQTCVSVSNCLNSTYGCCEDGYTPAQGPNGENCPKVCNCHPAGSYNQICDLRPATVLADLALPENYVILVQ